MQIGGVKECGIWNAGIGDEGITYDKPAAPGEGLGPMGEGRELGMLAEGGMGFA